MKKRLWVYIAVKDIGIWVLYFLLLKYDLTNETYTPSMQSNFPGAPSMDLGSMFGAALYITFLPLLADAVLLTVAERIVKPTYEQLKWPVTLGMLLHVPIVLFWWAMALGKTVTLNVASSLSLLLSFLVAGAAMWALRTQGQKGSATSSPAGEV